MEKKVLGKGDIVQLNPETTKNRAFSGCLLIVTEPKDFGALGYICGVGNFHTEGGFYYYRATFDEMELVGHARWVAKDEND